MFHMEKAELHVHLNGCVPPQKIRELVRRHNVEIPHDFDITRDLQVLKPVDSLLEYFKPWLVLRRLPVGKECLAEMVDAAVGTLAQDGVTYVEFRKSPFNISEINNISIDESLEWLTETLFESSQKYKVKANLVVSLSREDLDLKKIQRLANALKLRKNGGVIVGVDLSGDESIPINAEVAKFYRIAKDDFGLGVSIHAGETGSLEHIKWAIEECNADRLGHALAAGGCKRTLEVLRERDICLEVSLISNLRTGAVKTLALHPVLSFIDNCVPFVLSSDNPQLQKSSLSDEYALFNRLTSRQDLLESMFSTQTTYCFENGETRRRRLDPPPKKRYPLHAIRL